MRDEEEWTPEDRSGNGQRRVEASAAEVVEAARPKVRLAANTLFVGWTLVGLAAAVMLVILIRRSIGLGPVAPNRMAWNDLWQFLFWASAVVYLFGLFGIVSAGRMRDLRGYWPAVVAAVALL